MTTPRRTVRVPDDLWDKAADAAKGEGITVTDVVVRGLQRYVERMAALTPERSEWVREQLDKGVVPPAQVRAALGGAASKPFAKNCSKAQYHRVGRRCFACGGDHE